MLIRIVFFARSRRNYPLVVFLISFPMRSNIFKRLYFKHSYIEIYAFVSLISISATEKLLPQLLFKKACLTTFNVSLDLCKSDPLMNDRIQKNLADLMTRKSVIKLFVSPLSTLAIICVLLFYKTIKIIGVQIITHLLIAILTLWYDSYTHISSATLVYLYAILISFSNFSALIVVFYDYIIHKSTLKKRILRFLMLNLAVKIGSIVGCTFFGVLLKYIGSFHTFIVFMTILFISTIIFFTIEDYSNENRAALKLIWMGPERNFISAFYASIKQNFEEFKKRRARQKLGIMFALIGNSLNSMSKAVL
ncbi:hypothetical protein HZS_2128 [Henneguya salminicola]|nr:hypothetical protein HZS_2128 [Henneguya salminicola]